MRQPENVKIVEPLKAYLKYKGWHVVKFHGSQYQSGVPDLYAMHPSYNARWIECKLWTGDNKTSIHLTPAQKTNIPIWIAHGTGIWVIVGNDFRGITGKSELERAYQKLFSQPNGHYALHHSNWRYLK